LANYRIVTFIVPHLAGGCLLCGEPANWVGLWIPEAGSLVSRAMRTTIRAGGRLRGNSPCVGYALCERCHVHPDGAEDAEAVILDRLLRAAPVPQRRF
jgi:hypothetical protein